MGAPTPTARGTPSGRRIPEGFKVLITLGNVPTLGVWERDVKPPGIDGGEPISISTQHNTKYMTFYPRTLIKLDPITAACGFDPDVLPTLRAQINRNQVITVTYPDGSTDALYGWLGKAEPTDEKEGEFPIYNLTFFISNVDDTAGTSFVEQGPVFTAASGT